MKPDLTVINTPPLRERAKKRRTLADTTWEQRRKMTPQQLIELMGDGWQGHPKYKPRGRVPAPAIPFPNLATFRTEVLEVTSPRNFWQFLAWVFSS